MDRAGFEAKVTFAAGNGADYFARSVGGSGARLRMMPELTPLQDSSPPRRPNSIFGQRFMTTSMPARLGFLGRRIVADTQLHPHDLGADGDRVVDDRADLVGGAENVDHVDRVGNVAQGGVDFSPSCSLPAVPGLTGMTR